MHIIQSECIRFVTTNRLCFNCLIVKALVRKVHTFCHYKISIGSDSKEGRIREFKSNISEGIVSKVFVRGKILSGIVEGTRSSG